MLDDGIGAGDRPTPRAHTAQPLLTDEAVVARVLAGDLASFELIMRRYNQRIFRIVRAITADDDEAGDVVQETYVRAYEHLAQFEGRAKFSTWLTRIAIHEATARSRRLKRMRLSGGEHPDAGSAGGGARTGEDEASMKELSGLLASAIDALPDELRAVFVLRAVEELDTRETAECLELSESNVKVRLHRARAMLQTRIDETIGAETRRLYQFDGQRCDRIVEGALRRLAAGHKAPASP